MNRFVLPFLASIVLTVFSFSAKAYFVAVRGTSSLQATATTHLMVLGEGRELYDLFVKTAATKAVRLLEARLDNQVILIGPSVDLNSAKRMGFKIIAQDSAMISDIVIQSYVRKLKRIASVDVYAHANALQGSVLERNFWELQFLFEKDPVWNDIKIRSLPETYIMLHGCNTGIAMAPTLAKLIGLPVIGTMSGSNFQYPYENDLWMFDHSKGSEKKQTLAPYTDSALSCADGFCVRLKAENAAYKGYWGDWSQGGFPSFKVFCGNLSRAQCGKGISQAIVDYPTRFKISDLQDEENYQKQVQDYLCPDTSVQLKESCIAELSAAGKVKNFKSTYSPFRGKTLNCNLQKCEAYFECGSFSRAFNPGSCQLVNTNRKESTAFVNEYLFLVEAFGYR